MSFPLCMERAGSASIHHVTEWNRKEEYKNTGMDKQPVVVIVPEVNCTDNLSHGEE